MEFSLFFFADSGSSPADDRYRLLLESARFADAHGFAAVWTPERHFHAFGGLYPNPSVTGAALAAVTERLEIRAGSVVAPLHHPVRIAEEWSVVDNLSRGRAGISFASGWHPVDFVLQPQAYERRKELMVEAIGTVRRLWGGGEVTLPDGAGEPAAVRLFPRPVRGNLPVWVTSGGSPDTFRTAGDLGAGVLTHLLGQELDALERNIAVYRSALTAHAACAPETPAPGAGVALMLHTLIGTDREEVREQVREPFSAYLSSSMDLLMKSAVDAGDDGFDPARLSPETRAFLVARAFDRYFETGGLFGTVDDAAKTVQRLADAGIDEVACLIDFGLPEAEVMAGLHRLAELRERCDA
jgi:natural product biosynthesis luciferase-like monooxygenase protein